VKISELRELSRDELVLKLEELKGSYMKLRFQHATAQLDSPAKLRQTRRAVARINTLINQRNIEAAKEKAD